MTVRGIDVSAHQGEVDWRAVARSGIRFAFIRAFEGKDMDPTFERNRREALAAGLLVGSYSYLRARHPGRWQAGLLLEALGELQPGELPPVVDIETLDKRTPPEAQACILGWIEVMRQQLGRDPIVYTYPFFWRDDLRGAVVSEVARCPLWIADYRERRAPEVPAPWSEAVADWKTSLRASMKDALGHDPYWSRRLAAAEDGAAAVHLAVFIEPYLQFILDGKKTVESRFSILRCAPYRTVAAGDIVLLKRTAGPIVGICEVGRAWFFELEQPHALETIQRDFGAAICPQEGFWEVRARAKVATLVQVDRVTPLAAFECGKRDRRGWVLVSEPALAAGRLL